MRIPGDFLLANTAANQRQPEKKRETVDASLKMSARGVATRYPPRFPLAPAFSLFVARVRSSAKRRCHVAALPLLLSLPLSRLLVFPSFPVPPSCGWFRSFTSASNMRFSSKFPALFLSFSFCLPVHSQSHSVRRTDLIYFHDGHSPPLPRPLHVAILMVE